MAEKIDDMKTNMCMSFRVTTGQHAKSGVANLHYGTMFVRKTHVVTHKGPGSTTAFVDQLSYEGGELSLTSNEWHRNGRDVRVQEASK